MSPVLRQCAALYRELIKANISPAEADKLELWQIAALMSPSPQQVEESPEEMSRRVIEARYRAAREGRELDPDEVFSGMSESDIKETRARRSEIE